jgi:hypothetical protein
VIDYFTANGHSAHKKLFYLNKAKRESHPTQATIACAQQRSSVQHQPRLLNNMYLCMLARIDNHLLPALPSTPTSILLTHHTRDILFGCAVVPWTSQG